MESSLHWTLDKLRLRDGIFPEGFAAVPGTLPPPGFDPTGAWAQTFDIVQTTSWLNLNMPYTTYYGRLQVRRTPNTDGTASFSVDRTLHMEQAAGVEWQHTVAEFQCHADALATLVHGKPWRIATETQGVLNPKLRPMAAIEDTYCLREKGKELLLEWEGPAPGKPVGTALQPPVTSNWGLIDAVQRLGADMSSPLEFTMLEGLDKPLSGHRLQALGKWEGRFGPHEVTLFGFSHVGPGIMPTYYWVNEEGRLLIARFGMAAWVFTNKPEGETGS